MDYRPNKPRNLTTRKINTQLSVFKDKYLNPRSILKFLLPIILVLAITPIALVYLVNITYQRRTITTEYEIPLELRTGVVILKQSDILYDFDSAKQIINHVKDLYSKKRVTQIVIVSYNPDNNIISSIEPFQQFFKDIPTDSYKIDVSSKDIQSACNLLKDKYQINKFIITSYSNLLPRITYACSFQGLYAKPYLPKDVNYISKEDDFNETLKIILQTIFPE